MQFGLLADHTGLPAFCYCSLSMLAFLPGTCCSLQTARTPGLQSCKVGELQRCKTSFRLVGFKAFRDPETRVTWPMASSSSKYRWDSFYIETRTRLRFHPCCCVSKCNCSPSVLTPKLLLLSVRAQFIQTQAIRARGIPNGLAVQFKQLREFLTWQHCK